MLIKSALQTRAEAARERFSSVSRKPIVIEFAGVPKAGKTSTIGQISGFLKRCGFNVSVVVERASVCPIRDKRHSNFNIWTACTTLAKILETTQTPPRQGDPDVLILDRGLFDSISWLTMMERLARIRRSDREAVERFLRIDDWRKRITAVVVMTASPADSMSREKGHLPVEGSAGSIMNEEVLQQMLNTTLQTVERLKEEFAIFTVDTSSSDLSGAPEKTTARIAEIILNKIEDQLQEDVLNLPKLHVKALFNEKITLDAAGAAELVDLIGRAGTYQPRAGVEDDASVVQVLPVVVIRNKSGEVLRLRRKERDSGNPLHGQLVIWAGGHARKEDGAPDNALLNCAARELQEELRLSIESSKLKRLGAVYADSGGKTSKHLAIVYEWIADTDDIAIVLSTNEFYERLGTALSGGFVGLEELAQSVEDRKITEVWSAEIIRELLPKTAVRFTPRLI